ncbi:MAG: EFR1 family ferrodoxin [Oscillospiraceae bacterium]|nr:EFR1 family ferrodoxin [Oscillospiraceae bacterium]
MAVIFCFSGTGNSLYAANKIAASIGAEVRNMRGARAVDEISDEVIGFVFPTYFWGLPKSVRRFIGKLRIANKDAYIFAVTTYGGFSAGVCDAVNVLLKKQGVKLSYSAKVKMVENYLPGFECNDSDEVWKKSDEALDKIIVDISGRKRVFTAPYTVLNGLTQKAYPSNKPGCADKFTADGCVNCGLCAKICPNGNIKIEDGIPTFGDKCDLCLACLNNCPADAINYGVSTIGKKRYKNPRVSADELVGFNNKV